MRTNEGEDLDTIVKRLEKDLARLKIALREQQRGERGRAEEDETTDSYPPLGSGWRCTKKGKYTPGSKVGILNQLRSNTTQYEEDDYQGVVESVGTLYVTIRTKTGKKVKRSPTAGTLELYQ